MYVWGYGILGKGPKLESAALPELIPSPLFGCNELEPDVQVIDVVCGLHHFVALTSKTHAYVFVQGVLSPQSYGCWIFIC